MSTSFPKSEKEEGVGGRPRSYMNRLLNKTFASACYIFLFVCVLSVLLRGGGAFSYVNRNSMPGIQYDNGLDKGIYFLFVCKALDCPEMGSNNGLW